MLPSSFDPIILQDELIQTLQRSPITQQFAVLRAQELLQTIIERPMITSLKAEVERLQLELNEERKARRTMRSDSKKHSHLTAKESAQKDNQINILRDQVEDLNQRLEEAKGLCQQLEEVRDQLNNELIAKQKEVQVLRVESIRHQKQAEMLSVRKEELSSEINKKDTELKVAAENLISLQRQNEKKVREIEKMQLRRQQQLQKEVKGRIQMHLKDKASHQNDLRLKDSQIQTLKEERFQLKNEINGMKIDLTQLGAQCRSLKQQSNASQTQLKQLRDHIKQIKISFEKQRKMLNNRLYQLTHASKAYSKLKNRLKDITKALAAAKQEHIGLGRAVANSLRQMSQERDTAVRNLLDAVGEKVGKQVQQLAVQLNAQADEVRQAKGEVRLKEEIIDRLEKQLANGSKQLGQLKNDARQQKREEERLRRELKRTLQENEAKLSLMERKYADLYSRVSY